MLNNAFMSNHKAVLLSCLNQVLIFCKYCPPHYTPASSTSEGWDASPLKFPWYKHHVLYLGFTSIFLPMTIQWCNWFCKGSQSATFSPHVSAAVNIYLLLIHSAGSVQALQNEHVCCQNSVYAWRTCIFLSLMWTIIQRSVSLRRFKKLKSSLAHCSKHTVFTIAVLVHSYLPWVPFFSCNASRRFMRVNNNFEPLHVPHSTYFIYE